MATSDESRAVYRPSGNVHWFKFALGLCFAAGAALFMACCLEIALIFGFYYLIIAPIIATLVVAGVWILVLRLSHCRSPGVATWASIPLALLLYLGYYQVGLMLEVGVLNAHRIDWLPRYINFRMKTDVARDVHHRRENIQKEPDLFQQVSNWLIFGGEAFAVIAGLIVVGRIWSSKSYCEACGKWMSDAAKSIDRNERAGTSCMFSSLLRAQSISRSYSQVQGEDASLPADSPIVIRHFFPSISNSWRKPESQSA